jgi:hypothetical protein
VPARGSDFECTLGDVLAANVAEVGDVVEGFFEQGT